MSASQSLSWGRRTRGTSHVAVCEEGGPVFPAGGEGLHLTPRSQWVLGLGEEMDAVDSQGCAGSLAGIWTEELRKMR